VLTIPVNENGFLRLFRLVFCILGKKRYIFTTHFIGTTSLVVFNHDNACNFPELANTYLNDAGVVVPGGLSNSIFLPRETTHLLYRAMFGAIGSDNENQDRVPR